MAAVAGWRALRFITLTLKANAASLEDNFQRLNTCFAKLRKHEVWTENVKEAIATREVTRGKHDQWHVHLHILCSGSFIPHQQLKAAWYEATGDSFIVHVEAVHDRDQAAKYVAAYVCGGNEVKKWKPEEIREYATATHGKRLVTTYNGAKLPQADDDDGEDVIGPSTHLANVGWLLRAEKAGADHIGHACDILARLGNAHAAALDRDPPDRTLPEPNSNEIGFAVAVAEEVEKMFPLIPDAATLDSIRRHAFGEPAEPGPNRLLRMAQDPLWRPGHWER